MSKGNIKFLTFNQLVIFENKYKMHLEDDNVVVMTVGKKRKTYHNRNKTFYINAKCIGRRIAFSPEAINVWEEIGTQKHSLISIQQTVNILYSCKQDITLKNVKSLLKQKI